MRNKVSMEIKGGTDYRNGHNQVGEAEKSHQEAKKKHFSFGSALLACL